MFLNRKVAYPNLDLIVFCNFNGLLPLFSLALYSSCNSIYMLRLCSDYYYPVVCVTFFLAKDDLGILFVITPLFVPPCFLKTPGIISSNEQNIHLTQFKVDFLSLI